MAGSRWRQSSASTRVAKGRIEFGRDGQPFYLNGPYDNPTAVLRTLERSVGAGNFHFSVAGGPM
jgi:hypothetical protein